MVYYDAESGDIEHSGIVVQPQLNATTPPIVVSKWGKSGEYIHYAPQCPYDYTHAKCYRVES